MRQMLSRTLIQGGRPKDGIAQLDKLKVERPTSVQILVDLGDGWLKEGDNAKAAEQYRAALRLAPNNSRLHMLLGFTLESANESQGAIAEYRQALALEPGNSLAMNNLAYVLAEHGGQTEEALGLAQKALQISPKEPDLLETLGWIYLKKGLPNSAVKVYSDLCREWPDRPLYQHHLGLALLAEGDSAAGRKALQAALENHPDASEAAQIRHDLDRIGPR
jgi:Flp pilus assembly protein TadD